MIVLSRAQICSLYGMKDAGGVFLVSQSGETTAVVVRTDNVRRVIDGRGNVLVVPVVVPLEGEDGSCL